MKQTVSSLNDTYLALGDPYIPSRLLEEAVSRALGSIEDLYPSLSYDSQEYHVC